MTPNRPQRKTWWSLPFICAVALVGLLVQLLGGQPLNPAIGPEQAAALKAAAFYTEGGHSLADQMLKSGGVGFEFDRHAGIKQDTWRGMPTIYKFETMYMSAEAAEAGSGNRALALLARALAQQYKGAEDDPDLKRLFQEDVTKKVEFKGITRKPGVLAELTNAQKTAIDALSHYCEGGGGAFGLRSVLIDRMELDPNVAYEIQRTCTSDLEAMQEGLKRVKVNDRHDVMTRIVRDLDANFKNAQVEQAFAPWRKPATNPAKVVKPPFDFHNGPDSPGAWNPADGPTSGGGSGGGGGGGGGGSPSARRAGTESRPATTPDKVRQQWHTNRAADHTRFLERSYSPRINPGSIPGNIKPPTAALRKFSTVIRGGRGFGGVVFGNEVKDKGLPDVKSLRWKPDAASKTQGSLEVNFADGKSASLAGVTLEHMYAAHAIYFRKLGGEKEAVAPADPDDAIGLVGIQRLGLYFDCGPEQIVNRGMFWSVVMHPAICDQDLGWSALMCDVGPFELVREPILDAVKRESGDDRAKELRRLWDVRKATWKIGDVPMTITVREGSLVVAGEEKPAFNAALCEAAFITMNAYSGGGDDDIIADFADRFYPSVPALCKASLDYRQLNEFARVCAVVRWAKAKKGTFAADPPAPDPRPRAAGLIISDNGDVVAAPSLDLKSLTAGLERKVSLRMAILEARQPALKAVDKALDKEFLWDSALNDVVADALTSTPPAQPESDKAIQTLKTLMAEEKMQALQKRLFTLHADAWKNAEYKKINREADEAAIDDFEKKHFPELVKARAALALREKALREACPELNYWLELREERAEAKAIEQQRILGERNKKEGEAFLAENKKKEGIKTTNSGMQYEVIKQGSGLSPKVGDTVKIHYKGALLDGTEFGSTYELKTPETFEVGDRTDMIKGWTEALQLMKVGSKWRLYVPPELAYGERGDPFGSIGPNAVLVYEIELLGLEE